MSSRYWLGVIVMCAAAVLVASLAAFSKVYIENQRIDESVETIFGMRLFATPLTVETFDSNTGTMLATMDSISVGQRILARVRLAENFRLERRDLVVKDGVIVGVTPVSHAEFSEIIPGVKGLGVMHLTPEGELSLQYLLIGDPAPRP